MKRKISTETQSPKVKRASHDSERRKSGTSAQSMTGGSSPSSAAEGQTKSREVYLINLSTPKNKGYEKHQEQTRNSWGAKSMRKKVTRNRERESPVNVKQKIRKWTG